MDAPLQARNKDRQCSIEDCDKPCKARGLCRRHYGEDIGEFDILPINRKLKGEYRRVKVLNKSGYVTWYDPTSIHCNSSGIVYEHRAVLGDHLGRALLPHESAHHKNGDRTDNRLENLELWSNSQPAGQRVEDKVAWAREILDLYG